MMPEGQPATDLRPPMSCIDVTAIGSGRCADRDQLSVDAESAEHFVHRIAARDGGEDDLRAADLRERLARDCPRAVNVCVRAELLRELRLVLAARDGDGVEAHPRGELHAEVAEPANAVHGDEIAGARAAVPQRVEGGRRRRT